MDAVKIKQPELDIIERTTHYAVSGGWVFQTCIVREADGQRAYWDVPLSPLGDVR
jgi:hypothetical protein